MGAGVLLKLYIFCPGDSEARLCIGLCIHTPESTDASVGCVDVDPTRSVAHSMLTCLSTRHEIFLSMVAFAYHKGSLSRAQSSGVKEILALSQDSNAGDFRPMLTPTNAILFRTQFPPCVPSVLCMVNFLLCTTLCVPFLVPVSNWCRRRTIQQSCLGNRLSRVSYRRTGISRRGTRFQQTSIGLYSISERCRTLQR